jgi:hypothetical protein
MRWSVIALGWGLLAFAMAERAGAQDDPYKYMDQHPKAILAKEPFQAAYRAKKQAIDSSGPFSAQQQEAIKNYYTFHIGMGMASKLALNDPKRYPNWRIEIMRDLTKSEIASNSSKHQFLISAVVDVTKICLNPQFHPACRVNAALLLGELNQQEMSGRGRDISPPVPLASAREELIKLLRDPNEDPGVQVAAMVGLVRHAKALAAANTGDENLIKEMVQVLQQQPSGNGSAAEALRWKQRLAIEAIGSFGNPGALPLIQPFVADASLPMWLRCTAADAVGRMNYRNAGEVDQGQLAKSLGSLAVKAVKDQLGSLQTHIRENPETGLERRPIAGVEGGEGGLEAKLPEDWYVTQVRRELNYYLGCVSRGLQGLQKSNPDAAGQTAINQVLSATQQLTKSLETENMTPQKLFDQIGQPAVRLESAVTNL